MNNNIVNYILGGLVVFMVAIVFLAPSGDDIYDVNVTGLSGYAADGLDLQAVGALLKDTKDAESLERKLNDPSVGINNLDLDEDGIVDYLKVTEYGTDNIRGFSLSTELAPGEVQEVATIEVEKKGDMADIQVAGNSHIYGSGHYYHSSFSLVDYMLLSYLFSNHSFYRSPFGYGSYPSHYDRYETRSYRQYRNQVPQTTSTFKRSTSSTLSKSVSSPNAGKTATTVKAPLKNPTSTQKAFQARNPSKTIKSGGFGSPSTPRPMLRTGTKSGSSFGGK